MEVKTREILKVIRSTRIFTLPKFGNVEEKGYKSESAADVVTEIDQKVEQYLKEELAKIMPGVAFVGEEYGGDRTSDCFWLVDPIDGTGHFVRGIPFCTTMIALINAGQVVFSAIYDFVNDDMYYAELGKGAYVNEVKISVSVRPLHMAYLSLETNTSSPKNLELLSQIRNRANFVNTISSGFEFILVATGRIEGRLMHEPFGRDYDFAPGSLLVSEAGGIVRNFNSETYDYTNLNFIASNPTVYKELIEDGGGIGQYLNY
jgi:myo-inositol-1(or 4)-monophosphatase